MPEPLKRSSFRLPDGREVETYLVTLSDGRQVVRTREELQKLPAEFRVTLAPAPLEEEEGG